MSRPQEHLMSHFLLGLWLLTRLPDFCALWSRWTLPALRCPQSPAAMIPEHVPSTLPPPRCDGLTPESKWSFLKQLEF